MEDYKQKYEQANEDIKKIKDANNDNKELVDFIEYKYPELKESEDERIRKSLIEHIKGITSWNYFLGISKEQMLAWLEKQGEFKPIFRVGDYIRNKKTKDRVLIEQIDIANKVYCYVSRDDAAEIHSDFRFSEQNDWEIIGQKIVEQKLCMIQWKGDNLKEVINFTGKNKNFDKWFTSFEEYEKYVREHNDIFKLFNEDGSHYEVPVGAWIIKTPDGRNVASKAVLKQKLADKTEPKFKVGDWITNGACTIQITSVDDTYYWHDNDCVGGDIESMDKEYHFWTIQDAKDGDVLANDNSIIIFRSIGNYRWNDAINYYVVYKHNLDKIIIQHDDSYYGTVNTITFEPATKEQIDLLSQKMKEAGYEWDAEKKELWNRNNNLKYKIMTQEER